MPIATLTFNLPEEDCQFNIAVKSMNWALVAWDMDQKLKQYIKYGHKFENIANTIDTIREDLYNIIREQGVNLDDII